MSNSSKVLIVLIALLSLLNPTGISYIHYAEIHTWSADWLSGVVAMIGAVLILVVMFFMVSAWSSTKVLGKLIFGSVLACGLFIGTVTSMLDDMNNVYWFTILFSYLFVLWGMIYPRLTFSFFKTRNVDDIDME